LINRDAIRRDVIVVGASAGGLTALLEVFAGLPAALPAIIGVVMHVAPLRESHLVDVLMRRAHVNVVQATDGARLLRGTAYIAPPDLHMRFHDDRVILDRGPKQHRARPAIDPLFISAAETYGQAVAGVVLSGASEDGVGGLIGIKAKGGLSLIQDPREAKFARMPRAALAHDRVDAIYRAAEIAGVLARLATGQPVNGYP